MKTYLQLLFPVAVLILLAPIDRASPSSAEEPSGASLGQSAVLLQSQPENLPLPTQVAPPLEPQVPPGLMGGTSHSYNVEAWGGLLTPSDGATIAAISTVVDKAHDGVHSDVRSPAALQAVSVSLVFQVDPNADDWPALTSWSPTTGSIRSGLRQELLPMTWDYAERHPLLGTSASSIGPSLYWLEKAAAALPASRLGRGFSTGLLGLRAGAMEITSADRPKHAGSQEAELSDYVRVWLKRSANIAVAEGLSALMTAKQSALGPNSSNLPANSALAARGRPSFPFVVSYNY